MRISITQCVVPVTTFSSDPPLRCGRRQSPALTTVNTSVYILNETVMADTPRPAAPSTPLKPKVLHILLAVADGPRHGYSIMQEVLERTDGQVRLWPAALYGALRELEQRDLIAESEDRPAADQDDERRRYFAITAHGKRVLDAEVRRLEAIVQHARASRALRKPQRA
jgi:DNA-binding PadR family transcriptional regulator